MTRASHSSYWSFSGGWRGSISLKSPGMNFSVRRSAELPLICASKLSWKARHWSVVHSFGTVPNASGTEPVR